MSEDRQPPSAWRATVGQCVIPLGRAPEPGALPPALALVGDRPLLAWLLRELSRFGVEEAVLPHGPLSGEAERRLAGLPGFLPRPLRIRRVPVPAGMDASASLAAALPVLAPRFLACPGHLLPDFNLAPLLAAGLCATPGQAAGWDGGIAVLDRARVGRPAPAWHPPEAAGAWFDAGSAAGLARARALLPARLHRPALLLDRDGTLNIDYGWVGSRDRFAWMPGGKEAVRLATSHGWHVFVVTNQSGIARGHYDEAAVAALHGWMCDELRAAGGTVDDIRYCPWHPEAPLPQWRRASDWRKPAPGMLLDLIRCWELDPRRALMIGDQRSDLAAAAAAGVQGHLFAGGDLAAFIAPLLGDAPPA